MQALILLSRLSLAADIALERLLSLPCRVAALALAPLERLARAVDVAGVLAKRDAIKARALRLRRRGAPASLRAALRDLNPFRHLNHLT